MHRTPNSDDVSGILTGTFPFWLTNIYYFFSLAHELNEPAPSQLELDRAELV
jgi:hypothetical protein